MNTSFYQDECHLKMTLAVIRAWFPAGSRPEIKSPADSYKVNIFGALGKNGQLITIQNEIFNAITFRLFLRAIDL